MCKRRSAGLRASRLVAAIWLLTGATAAYAVDCNELLRLGYRNIAMSVSEEDSRKANLRDFCEEHYQSASKDKRRQIEAAYKVVTGKFSTTDEEVKQEQSRRCDFSKEVSSRYAFQSQQSAEISSKALNAWTQCISLESRGLKFEMNPTPDLIALTVQISWGGGTPTEFLGVEQNWLGGADCSATRKGAGVLRANADTAFQLGPDKVTITCRRRLDSDSRGDSAKPLRLTFKTLEGSFDIDLPAVRLAQIPVADLKALHEQVATVTTGNAELLKKVETLEAKKPRLVCRTSAAESGTGRAPEVLALVPESERAKAIVTGGSCKGILAGHHHPYIKESHRTENGWRCSSHDYPGTPNVAKIWAEVIYCRVED